MIRSLLPAAKIVFSFFRLATQHLRCNRIAKPDGQNLLQYLSLYFDPQRTMLRAAAHANSCTKRLCREKKGSVR